MPKKMCNCEEPQEINSGHFIELADRLDMAMDITYERILGHPIVCAYPELKGPVEDALDKLMDAYQLVGTIGWGKEMKDKTGATIKVGDICHGGTWIEYINEIVNLDGTLYVKPIYFRFSEISTKWKEAPEKWQKDLLPLEVYGHSGTGEQTGVANSLGVLDNITLDGLTLDWVKETFK